MVPDLHQSPSPWRPAPAEPSELCSSTLLRDISLHTIILLYGSCRALIPPSLTDEPHGWRGDCLTVQYLYDNFDLLRTSRNTSCAAYRRSSASCAVDARCSPRRRI